MLGHEATRGDAQGRRGHAGVGGALTHLLLLAASVAALTALVLGAADAHALQCGKTINKSVTLKDDLLDCPEDGLIAGADGITIDLNGHRVDGTPGGDNDLGISAPVRDDITVKGPGRITGFEWGAYGSGERLKLRNLRFKNNELAGGYLQGIDGKVRNNVFRNTGMGVDLEGTSGARVIANEIFGADTTDGVRVELDAEDSLVRGNDIHDLEGMTAAGLRVLFGADSTRLVGNKITRSSSSGIQIGAESTSTKVRDNVAKRSGKDGILIQDTAFGGNNRLIGNRAHRNGESGIVSDIPGVVINDNRANNNDTWGIVAHPGSLGDGNTTKGNGVGECFPEALCG